MRLTKILVFRKKKVLFDLDAFKFTVLPESPFNLFQRKKKIINLDNFVLQKKDHLPKKKIFDKDIDQEKKKYIPKEVRKLLRRKMKISKKILSSKNWRKKNYKLSEELESIKNDLYCAMSWYV